MSRAYDYWIHSQLEPTDILIVGKSKREPRQPVPVLKPYPEISEYDRARREDENIEAHYKTNDNDK